MQPDTPRSAWSSKADRRTEHGHDAVAGELVHRAAVALHHRGRTVDQLGHDLAQPLRTDRRGDVHRVHHVGEQDRDLLVLGRCRGSHNRRTALVTELRVRRQLRTARPAHQGCRRHLTRPGPLSFHGTIVSPLSSETGAMSR